jgi:hypothetical protein
MMRWLSFLLIFTPLSAEIITPERRTTWQGYVGIPGGIPDSSAMTVYTTVPAGASLATVQAAINACPNEQVVQLSAGAYSFADFLNIDRSNCVLRGAGMDATTITFTAFGGELRIRGVPFTSANETALSVDADLSVDATEGSHTLTLASVPAWVTVGELIGIDQLDDAAFVNSTGTEPGGSYREFLGNGPRGLAQLNRVTAKTATTITVDSPLLYGFKTAQTAQIFQPFYNPSVLSSAKNSGVEDMTIKSTQTGNSMMIRFETADNCWAKNVEIENMSGAYAVWVVFSYRCQMAQLYIHDSHLYGSGQAYGVAPWYVTTRCLIEDSIFLRLHNAMTCNYGASGNVFAYNFELEGMSDSGQQPSMNTHGVHAFKNLWEGNYCEDKLLADWTHGSASHGTVFRNRITGENGIGDSRTCISVEYYNRYWNIVGNILGVDGFQNKYLQHSGSPDAGTEGSIVKIGGEININSDFTPSDAASYTTGSFILLHGNYDYVTDGQNWEASIADHVIPNSLYLSAKPAFFGDLDWPPFDPGSPGTAARTNIPAGNREIEETSPTDSIAVATAVNTGTLHVGDFSVPSSVTQDFDSYTPGTNLATLPGWTVTSGSFATIAGGMVRSSRMFPDPPDCIAAYQPSGFRAAVNHQVEVTIGILPNIDNGYAIGAAIAIQPDRSCYYCSLDPGGNLYFGFFSSYEIASDYLIFDIEPFTYEGTKIRMTVTGSGATRVCTVEYDKGSGWVSPSGWTNRDFGPGKRLDGGKGGIIGYATPDPGAITSLTITNL